MLNNNYEEEEEEEEEEDLVQNESLYEWRLRDGHWFPICSFFFFSTISIFL